MATAKKRQDGELSEKILADVNSQQRATDEGQQEGSVSVTSQISDSFSPNQMQEKRFSHESGSTTGDESEKCQTYTSSNNSYSKFHDRGVSMATVGNSQSQAFKPMINLFTTESFRSQQQQVQMQNNPLVVIGGGGQRLGEVFQQGFPPQRKIFQS